MPRGQGFPWGAIVAIAIIAIIAITAIVAMTVILDAGRRVRAS